MSGYGTRPTSAPVNVAANRQRFIDALMGIPSRVGGAFTGMAQQGLAANEAFLQGRGPEGEDLYARPLMPGADTGGRLGALASFVNSNMAMGGPAGSLGAGISTEGRASKAAAIASRPSALPMDEASRMQRAKEMGFDTNKVLYHGTMNPENISEFKLGLNKAPGESGIFFATDPNIADLYAGYNPPGTVFPAPKTGAVFPAHVRPGKQLVHDFEGGKHGRDEIIRRAQAEGYDSVLLKNHYDAGGIQDQVVILDPRNIRSRFAAFDPAKRNSADLLASYGPNPLAAALYSQQQE